jgi:hypothetical protein
VQETCRIAGTICILQQCVASDAPLCCYCCYCCCCCYAMAMQTSPQTCIFVHTNYTTGHTDTYCVYCVSALTYVDQNMKGNHRSCCCYYYTTYCLPCFTQYLHRCAMETRMTLNTPPTAAAAVAQTRTLLCCCLQLPLFKLLLAVQAAAHSRWIVSGKQLDSNWRVTNPPLPFAHHNWRCCH